MSLNCFQLQSLKLRVTLLTLVILLLGFWSLTFYASRILREDKHALPLAWCDQEMTIS